MGPSLKVVVFTKRSSVKQVIETFKPDQFIPTIVSNITGLPSAFILDFDIAIVDFNDASNIKDLLLFFNALPTLVIFSAEQPLSMDNIHSDLVDFVFNTASISEIELRCTRLYQKYVAKVNGLKESIALHDFEKMFANHQDSVYTVEVRGANEFKLLGFNQKLENIVGVKNAQIKDKPLDALTPFMGYNGVEQMKSDLNKVYKFKKAIPTTAHAVHKEKLVSWDHLLLPVLGTNQEVTHIIGLSVNNSLVSIFNEIISEQESYFHSLFESSRDAILVLNTEGKFIDCNMSAVHMFRAESKKNLINRYPWDVSPNLQPSHQPSKKVAEQHISSLKDYVHFNWTHRRFDQVEIACSIQLSMINRDAKKQILAIIRDVSSIEQTQLALRQSEQVFKKLFKQMSDGFCINQIIYDTNRKPIDYIFVDINKSLEEILGFLNTEIIGHSVSETFPAFTQEVIDVYHEIATKGITSRFEYFSKQRQKYFRVIAYKTGDNKIATHFSDITPQKMQALRLQSDNKTLQEELLTLSTAIYKSPVSIILTNPDYNITYVNDAFIKLSGYTLEDSFGKKPHDLLRSSKNNEKAQREIQGTLQKGETWSGEILSKHKNGQTFWDYTYIIPTIDDQKELTGMIILKEDFSERKKQEEKLRKNEKQLQTILQHSPAAMAFISADGYIAKGNQQLSQILGAPLEDIVGQNPFHRLKNSELLKKIRTALTGEASVYRGIYHVDEEKDVFMKAVLNPISPGQAPTDVVAIIEDITEQYEYESKLESAKIQAESANNAKSSFLANMSHEIRTPLNAVLGFAELLRKGIHDPILGGYANSILKSGNTLLHLINDVLDMSKIEAGMLTILNESINIKHIVSDLESIFQLQVQQKGLSYIAHVEENVPDSLLLDNLRLRQILLNLTTNAIKFTKKGYVKIVVSANVHANNTSDITIKISDSGKGIEKESFDKIFEAFNQKDQSITRDYGGSGLGLTISRKLAELMGGKLSVESTPEKGSTFILELYDVVITNDTKLLKEELNTEEVHYDNTTVFVADKNPFNLEILTEILGPKVGQFQSFETPDQIVAACKKSMPNLILMDRRMSSEKHEFPALEIANMNKSQNIPIIALTASIFLDHEKDVRKLGFTEFIRRPINEKEMVMILDKYLGLSSKNNTVSLNSTAFVDLSKEHQRMMKQHIKTQILPSLETLNKNQSMRAVKSLSELLINTDLQFNIKYFGKYGHEIQMLSLSFDVAEIRNKLISLEMDLHRILNLF